jgi:hypothetical protein
MLLYFRRECGVAGALKALSLALRGKGRFGNVTTDVTVAVLDKGRHRFFEVRRGRLEELAAPEVFSWRHYYIYFVPLSDAERMKVLAALKRRRGLKVHRVGMVADMILESGCKLFDVDALRAAAPTVHHFNQARVR